MEYCSRCGEKLPEGAYFCFKCGTRTTAGAAAGATIPIEELRYNLEKAAQEVQKAFSRAAKEMDEALRKAREGIKEPIRSGPAYCPQCGERNSPSSRFCHKCGKKLD
jgi:uncharacterized membrane protein YvbJ